MLIYLIRTFKGMYEHYKIIDTISSRIQSITMHIKNINEKRSAILHQIIAIKRKRENEFIVQNKNKLLVNLNLNEIIGKKKGDHAIIKRIKHQDISKCMKLMINPYASSSNENLYNICKIDEEEENYFPEIQDLIQEGDDQNYQSIDINQSSQGIVLDKNNNQNDNRNDNRNNNYNSEYQNIDQNDKSLDEENKTITLSSSTVNILAELFEKEEEKK